MTGFITIEEFVAKHGGSVGTIRKRVSDGLWQRGLHYASPTGDTTFVHEARALEWEAGRKGRASNRQASAQEARRAKAAKK